MMDNNNGMGNPYGMMMNGYNPNMYSYPVMGYTNAPQLVSKNPLTDEEIKLVKNTRPNNLIDLSIEVSDNKRSMCNHHHPNTGADAVAMITDGSENMFCTVCNEIFVPTLNTREEVQAWVDNLYNAMNVAKWCGTLPTNLIREYFQIMPMLKKFPDIYDYATSTFDKYFNNTGMFNAGDQSIYSMYNSVMNGGGYPNVGFMGAPMQGYYGGAQFNNMQYYGGQQQPNMQFQNNPMMQQMMQGGGMQGYVPNNGMQEYIPNNMQQNNPYMNPMQAPMYGGVNPMAPNQQFVNQANMMMGGTITPNGQQQQMMQNQSTQTPVFNANTMQQQTQPVNNEVQDKGPIITQNKDGSVSSKKKIEL